MNVKLCQLVLSSETESFFPTSIFVCSDFNIDGKFLHGFINHCDVGAIFVFQKLNLVYAV